jgi:hypothetical protein
MLTQDKANRVHNSGAIATVMERMFVPCDVHKVQQKTAF